MALFAGRAFAQPVANFTASPTSGCAPMVVSFTSTSTGSPSSYSWTFGNGNTSTAQNPTTSYTTPGTYTVSLTVTNAAGSNTKTQTSYITVKQPPAVSFSATPRTICPGVPVSFTSSITWNAAGSGTYSWDFGDGGSSTGANPTHTYTAGGSYTVKLTAINSVGCPATDTQANFITVYPKPVADFVASDTAICALSGATTFTSLSSGTGTHTYIWDFGDGSPLSTSGSPVTHAYSAAGAYTVRMIMTDANGCSDTETKSAYINVRVVSAGFSAASAACAGASVSMSSASTVPAGATVNWNFGDGNTGSGRSSSHGYLTSGTYTITQYVTVGGCTATATNSITINPRPSVSFSYSPTAPCPAPVTVTFTNTNSSSGTTYAWNFGDGFSGFGTPVLHTYTISDTFTVTLTAVNSYGCSASAVQNIIIRPMKLVAKSDKISGCAPLTVNFKDTLLTYDDSGIESKYPYPIVARTWDFGDGSMDYSATPTHIYTNPGSYVVVLTATTSNGCTIIDTIGIKAGNHPTAAFGGGPRTVCVNEPVSFTDSSTTSLLPIDTWLWDFGDGGKSILQHPTTYYNKPDTFDVTLIVGINGCYDTLTKTTYVIVNFPKARMEVRVSCDTPRLVHFADSSVGATSHIWYFGDGSSSTASHPSHMYSSAGIYIVSLVAFNSSTGCKDSIVTQLNLNPLSISFSAVDTTLCKGDTLRLNSSYTGGGVPAGYAWWIGSGSGTPAFSYTPPDGPSKSRVMPFGGQYHVALEAKDQNNCIVKSIIRKNYITVGAPAVTFRCAPPVGCYPATILFKDSTSYSPGTYGVTRTWKFGDGSGATTTSPNISHAYTSAGSFGIFLKVVDNIGCTDSLDILNYLIVSHPTAVFTSATKACVGRAITFFSSSTGTALKYQWSFGDGGTSTASSPSHIYTTPGVYSIRLIVTDYVGCSDTMTQINSVTVNGKPTAAFTMDDTISVCPPLIVNFTDKSTGAASYNWSLGTGATSTLQNPSNTYTLPQIYTIRFVVTNSVGCTDTAFGRVRILGYAGVLSYSPLKGCAPLTVNFKANNVDGVAGFIYDFGDGITAATTATTISHIYKKAGPHIPKVTLTDNLGCTVTSVGIDTIKVDGVIAGFTFSPFPACNKGTIQFIDTSRGTYSVLNHPPTWLFGDGTTSTLDSPFKTYTGPGTYAVTLYHSTSSGCKDTFRSNLIFHPLPAIDAGPDTTICLTDYATLQPRGGVSYVWSPGATLSCTACTNPVATPTVPTRYVVIGTDAYGCTNRDSMMVRIRTKTTADVSPGTEICSGEQTRLSATGGSTYEWSPPTGLSDSHVSNPVASPTTTQHYTVITKLASCIPDTDYVDIIVHPTPVVDAGPSQTMIAGSPVQLQAVGSGFITFWTWSPATGLSCTDCAAPEATPKRSTTYIVTASTEFDCRATDSVRITVLCDNSQVFIPNTFTPEGNGVNDVFYPRGRGIETISRFRIYNRWGEVVFERSNMQVDDRSAGWDGRKDGRLLSPDIFVYTVEAICDTGEPIRWQGDVMLLR